MNVAWGGMALLKEQIDSLLDRVQKPARYMGGEMNCVLKDSESVDIRYAFAFPDVYEVGMSHLGSRILYDIINKRSDALCERVFMPWVDMADLMRKEGDSAVFRLKHVHQSADLTCLVLRFNMR